MRVILITVGMHTKLICDRILENRPNCHICQNRLFCTKRGEVMNTITWRSFIMMRKIVAVIDAHLSAIHWKITFNKVANYAEQITLYISVSRFINKSPNKLPLNLASVIKLVSRY